MNLTPTHPIAPADQPLRLWRLSGSAFAVLAMLSAPSAPAHAQADAPSGSDVRQAADDYAPGIGQTIDRVKAKVDAAKKAVSDRVDRLRGALPGAAAAPASPAPATPATGPTQGQLSQCRMVNVPPDACAGYHRRADQAKVHAHKQELARESSQLAVHYGNTCEDAAARAASPERCAEAKRLVDQHRSKLGQLAAEERRVGLPVTPQSELERALPLDARVPAHEQKRIAIDPDTRGRAATADEQCAKQLNFAFRAGQMGQTSRGEALLQQVRSSGRCDAMLDGLADAAIRRYEGDAPAGDAKKRYQEQLEGAKGMDRFEQMEAARKERDMNDRATAAERHRQAEGWQAAQNARAAPATPPDGGDEGGFGDFMDAMNQVIGLGLQIHDLKASRRTPSIHPALPTAPPVYQGPNGSAAARPQLRPDTYERCVYRGTVKSSCSTYTYPD